MKKISVTSIRAVLICLIASVTLYHHAAGAEEILRYSCSAQIYEAFGQERIDAFTKETGIKVDLFVSSSGSAVYRLMNGFSDIASTTRGLYYRHKESGYMEFPFCKDPIAVITHVSCTVRDITSRQLQDFFSGEIKNWKDVGGPDEPILVVLPGKTTGNYKNFERLAMGQKEMIFDFMTYKSTMVIEAVKRFPWSVSFISLGANVTKGATKTLKIDGLAPTDKEYPYHQTFSFITNGEPSGPAKKFIDFAMSEKGLTIMKEKGMVPILK